LRHKDLDFNPFIEVGLRPFGVSKDTMKKCMSKLKDDGPSFLDEAHKDTYEQLDPGPELNRINAIMLKSVTSALNGLPESFEVDSFYLWLRRIFTVATCSSIFGEHDPFAKDSSLIDAMWYVLSILQSSFALYSE
jgi:hypothetical protein